MPVIDLGKVVGADGVGVDALTVYPVGSIYMSVNSTSPASLFGGAWERLVDRFLLGAGSAYAGGATGGSATHTLTVAEMPSHSHQIPTAFQTEYAIEWPEWTFYPKENILAQQADPVMYNGQTTTYVGENHPHNNMPPYLAVYMWKRVS